MDIFNIGTGELFFILVLAILLVGPRRAVELVQQIGRLMARLQREWRSVQQSVLTEVNALKEDTLAAVDPGLKEIAEEVRALEQEALAAQAQEQAELETPVLPSPAAGQAQPEDEAPSKAGAPASKGETE